MKYRPLPKNTYFPLLFLLALLLPTRSLAQFQEAEVGINGLTCSMCSYSVENSIKKLTYIKLVKMDLNSNIAEITSEKGTNIIFPEVAERVRKSGFSVRYISFQLKNEIVPDKDGKFELGGKNFYLIGSASEHLSAGSKLKLIGEAFLPKTELKKELSKLSSEQKKMLKEGQTFFVIHEN